MQSFWFIKVGVYSKHTEKEVRWGRISILWRDIDRWMHGGERIIKSDGEEAE